MGVLKKFNVENDLARKARAPMKLARRSQTFFREAMDRLGIRKSQGNHRHSGRLRGPKPAKGPLAAGVQLGLDAPGTIRPARDHPTCPLPWAAPAVGVGL